MYDLPTSHNVAKARDLSASHNLAKAGDLSVSHNVAKGCSHGREPMEYGRITRTNSEVPKGRKVSQRLWHLSPLRGFQTRNATSTMGLRPWLQPFVPSGLHASRNATSTMGLRPWLHHFVPSGLPAST